MGKRSHILPAALIAAMFGAPGEGADLPDDPLLFFAHCTGRLSAELSHHWMMASARADDIEALRRQFIEVLEMMTPEGAGREVLGWRLDARAAHAALLTRATFQDDAWARDRAASEIAHCASFLLGPSDAPTAEPAATPPLPASQLVP